MKYSRFEDLPVWQDAIEFAVKVYELTAQPAFKGHYSLKDQLERAAVSVSNNIAEGFERGTTNELLTFLYIARGSCGECRSELRLLERIPVFQELQPQIGNLLPRAASISRQLKGWADSLQNSDFKGARYVTDKTRRGVQNKAAQDEVLEFGRRARNLAIENNRRRAQGLPPLELELPDWVKNPSGASES